MAETTESFAANSPSLSVAQIDEKVDLARLSVAMRKLANAASSARGADCYVHAALCKEIMSARGVESRLVVGFAAWRVGNEDGAVITHAPMPGMATQHPLALPFHAWLEVGDLYSQDRVLIDFTTYQLKRKAAELDELDGGHTTVNWCPNYLAAPASKVSSMREVSQLRAGMFFYEHNPTVERVVTARDRWLDREDLAHLILIYNNPSVVVFGSNDVG